MEELKSKLQQMKLVKGDGMKMIKKIESIIVLVLMSFALSGCNNATVKVNTAETYPTPDELVVNLENADFEVESFDSFEELEIETTRIKATKGKQYLDICYNVLSSEDSEEIAEYYKANYNNYKLVRNADIVFCCSSEYVKEVAGLW